MPTYSLEGLFKWLRHEQWREPFEGILALHLEPACRNADIQVDDIASLLGTDTYMNLWGCAFENFLSREFEDGRNFVADYLKRRGWKESAANRAYIQRIS